MIIIVLLHREYFRMAATTRIDSLLHHLLLFIVIELGEAILLHAAKLWVNLIYSR